MIAALIRWCLGNRFLVVLLALAAACVPQEGHSPAPDDDAQVPPVVEATADAIVGTYLVTHVDGAPPTINIEGNPPTVTIGEKRIQFQSQCIYADWTYTRDGEAISTKPYFEPGSAMCARGLAPGEVAIQESFEQARTIRRVGGDLHVEGGAHRLQLRQVADRASS